MGIQLHNSYVDLSHQNASHSSAAIGNVVKLIEKAFQGQIQVAASRRDCLKQSICQILILDVQARRDLRFPSDMCLGHKENPGPASELLALQPAD